eukprot:CAMPEP_0197533166 /NCGR_PEP_ID=MMETSP1318-20131121/42518_1 /TAXON_ID=552666 /ORGANISM="Partenskyella glossopodia, Strain RCC365" /LENGTH=177 /DNA_ID=CAMNT_0043089969 /DNA_START=922 /DNA_END=1457 /DNA_ORIENTATION=+
MTVRQEQLWDYFDLDLRSSASRPTHPQPSQHVKSKPYDDEPPILSPSMVDLPQVHKERNIPLQWDQKASTQMKAYKKIDVVEAHLKMFSGMYGLYVFLILFMPPMSEAIPPPDNATEFYARIVVGQALVVGLFLIITLLSPNHPAALMHTLRAIRYGSVPFTTFLMCPGAFSLFGAV